MFGRDLVIVDSDVGLLLCLGPKREDEAGRYEPSAKSRQRSKVNETGDWNMELL